MMKPTASDNHKGWQWKRGWIAFAIYVLGVEGLIAGGSRSCMPSFDLGILLGQLLLLNVLGSPILSGVLGGSAFVVAASPQPISRRQKWPRLIFLAIGLIAVILAIGFRFATGTIAVAIGFLGSAVLVGVLVRRIGVDSTILASHRHRHRGRRRFVGLGIWTLRAEQLLAMRQLDSGRSRPAATPPIAAPFQLRGEGPTRETKRQ